MNIHLKAGILVATALAGSPALPAWAQDTPEANEARSDDIVVTARKVTENLQDVPLSISAVSGETLREQSVRTIIDIQSQTPGLFLQPAPSDPQSISLAIRGQKQNDIAISLDPSVGIYVDGYYSPRTIGVRGALVDVQRVEILRGPQGTLYGRNTTGGAFSIYTQDPVLGVVEGMVEASIGNYDTLDLTGVINVPLGEKAALRVVGQFGQHDGYAKDGLGRDLGEEEGYYLRAKLKSELADGFTVTLSGSYLHNNAGQSIIQLAGVSPTGGSAAINASRQDGITVPEAIARLNSYVGGVGGDFYRTGETTDGFSHSRITTIGLDLNLELNDTLSIRSLTGYVRNRRQNVGGFDGTPYVLVSADRRTISNYYSQELHLIGNTDSLNWVFGLYGGIETGRDRTLGTSVPLVNPNNPNDQDASINYRNYAIFGQVNWALAENTRLTVGARYSGDRRALTLRNNVPSNPCVVPAPGVGTVTGPNNGTSQCPRTFVDKFSDPSWLISLDHRFNDAVLVYTKIARGYRTGGRNQRGAVRIETFAPFNPETVTDYEIGFKTDFLDRAVRWNIAFYHDDYNDIQRSASTSVPTGAPVTIVTNAAKARVRGIESDVVVRPTPQLTLRGGLNLTDARYKNFLDATIGDRSRETFGVPKWTYNLSGRYELPVGDGDLAFQADWNWQSTVILVPETPSVEQMTQKPYGLLNGRISYTFGREDAIELAVFGRNLTKRKYFASGVSSERSLGYNYKLVGEPRTYGVSASMKF